MQLVQLKTVQLGIALGGVPGRCTSCDGTVTDKVEEMRKSLGKVTKDPKGTEVELKLNLWN